LKPFYKRPNPRREPDASEPRRYLRQHIGIVEQEPFLFSRSIRENIS
jgi:ABC-type transport system involved in cytochrome bd biosynthesis fused ATPase/permease subunit